MSHLWLSTPFDRIHVPYHHSKSTPFLSLGWDPEDLLCHHAKDLQDLMLKYPSLYHAQYRAPAGGAHKHHHQTIVEADKDKFMVSVDVQQFQPDEITVKVVGDDSFTVEAKHEEKPDEHGTISRCFKRRYVVPAEYDITKLTPKLSTDGVLTILAPKIEHAKVDHRTVPIIHTGLPSKPAPLKEHQAEGKEKAKK